MGFSRCSTWALELRSRVVMCGLNCPVACGIFPVCVLTHFSCVRLSEITWTAARQAPLTMGFSRQEYWSGLPFPSPFPSSKTRVKPALAGGFLMTGPLGRSCMTYFEVKHLRKRTRSGLRTQEPKICNSAKNTPGDFKVIMMTSHLVFGARPFSVTFQCNTCNTPTSVTCYCHDHFFRS